ncbi:DUF1376 domain-containing protein [Nitrosospira lacus]|uniref:DUF1376 domain-containing protein n=1 Tax=Nitrosospira lacus TaxID=1288494 RepID=A0A1W6SPJ3_9PROT|nr:YdaU family protein [Nitrosospira lacus]ARO87726.1 DUF1376 domain-containing protein [Nitrosospira lacus]
MNYYERYCGDYQRDTAHLSLAEHGAYTMLLDTYFSVEKPLPKELPALFRVCRAMTRVEQQAVKAVADQFFPISGIDGLRHNARADREIAKARPKIEAARINGRKGGRPSKEKESVNENRNEIPQKPPGLFVGSENPASERTSGAAAREPGGEAHQHQHQFHKSLESIHTQTIYPSDKEMRGDPLPAPEPIVQACHENGAAALMPPGVAGACCKSMARQGVQACNPHHPTLLALLQAGAVEEEFVEAARSAAIKGKANFAYVIGTVKRQREEAAKLVLHQGRMPNRQELLEASNKAATKDWLPPELRVSGPEGSKSGENRHANQ